MGDIVEHGIGTLVQDVQTIVENGLQKAYRDVNITTVTTYWQVGDGLWKKSSTEQQGPNTEAIDSKIGRRTIKEIYQRILCA